MMYAQRFDRRPFLKDATESAVIFANYVGAAMTNAELYLALGESEGFAIAPEEAGALEAGAPVDVLRLA